MRILTVFFMSIILCLLGVVYVAFPELWLNAHPWDSPLIWGGAIVLAAWWGSIRALTGDANQGSGAPGHGGVGFIITAAAGAGLIMYLIA